MSESQAVRATLLAEERRLRQIEDHEEAVLIDITKGRVLWRKAGGAMGIGFDAFEIRQMAGNILSHNHPIGIRPLGEDLRVDGESFSPSDIGMLVEAGLAELRAVTHHYTYSVRPPDPMDESLAAQAFRQHVAPYGYDHVVDILKVFSEEVLKAQQRMIADPRDPLTRSQAEAIHYHLVMVEIARSWGLQYRREKVQTS